MTRKYVFDGEFLLGFAIIVFFAIFLIGGLMAVIPRYRVWSMEMSGRAQLAEAEWAKQVIIAEANARLEAARLDAQSEVERARGMAQAMEIEGGLLTMEYIQYLWVLRNDFQNQSIVYIPTNGVLPFFLESGRGVH